MPVCIQCHFETQIDDIVLNHSDGRVVCLRCYSRNVGNKTMPDKALRRDLEAACEQIDTK